MKTTRILHLEDSPEDAELAAAALAADGLVVDIVRVQTADAFAAALDAEDLDVILADYNLPSFDGLSAQRLAAERRPDVAFIFVSGTLGEEIAIERMKSGATDYVLKQRLDRLPSSVRRALREMTERAERRAAEAEIRRLNADLEQRVIARTAELGRANETLAARERELHDAKRFLDSVVDNIPVGVLVKDADTLRVVRVNRAMEDLLGVGSGELVGERSVEYLPAAEGTAAEDHDRDVLSGVRRGDIVERQVPTRTRGVRTLQTKKIPLVDDTGEPRFVLAIAEDVTEQKRAEQAIESARMEAERANRAKSDFLSRMSHDLRTPLNAVLGFAQVLATDELNAEQHESVQQILRAGTHVLQLINEVLDIARVEAGHLSLSPEPVDVPEIIQHALGLIGPLASQRDISLTFDSGADRRWAVLADRQRLNQILLNLLSNAVKYNQRGGRVTVALEPTTDGRLRINVADTGAGIPPDKLQLLFTPFERLGADATAIEGTGLGLTISKALTEAMGGSLGVASQIDRGTTFWIELPLTEPAADRAESRHELDVTTAPSDVAGTVLYIEDNAANVRLMERVFKRRPRVTLQHASTGQIGLSMARERPDVIFLDLHLPDLHGEEVLRQLWTDPELRSIPVVVLSADATAAQSRRLRAAGAAEYLTKPLEISMVLRVLDHLLNVRRVEDCS